MAEGGGRVSPRRAVILAAGMGSRLYPLTADRPKAMVAMLDEPVLHRSIRNLARRGITQIAVVVGYEADFVMRETGAHLSGADITYVVSPEYHRTGTAVSLLQAATFMTEDVLVLEADVLFEDDLLERLLENSAGTSLAAIAAFEPPLSGTVVTLAAGTRIASFTRGVPAGEMAGSFKTVNLYWFTRAFLSERIVPALERSAAQAPMAYVEDVLAALVAEDPSAMTGVDCTDCRWFEVDDHADLDHARRLFGQPARGDEDAQISR